MRKLALVILLLVCALGRAQGPKIALSFHIKDRTWSAPVANAKIEIICGEEVLATKYSNEEGKVDDILVPINAQYRIVFSKEGHISKFATLDATYNGAEDLSALPEIPFPSEVTLFELNPCYDYSFLEEEPMINFSLDQYGNQSWDSEYLKVMLEKIEAVESTCVLEERSFVAEDQSKDPEWVEYYRLYKKGEVYEAEENYEMALSYYRRARVVKSTPQVNKKVETVGLLRDQ